MIIDYPPFSDLGTDPDYTFIGADIAAAYRKAQTQPPQKLIRAQPDPLPEQDTSPACKHRTARLGGRRIA